MIRAFGLATEKICITRKLGRELDRELASTNFVAYFGLLKRIDNNGFQILWVMLFGKEILKTDIMFHRNAFELKRSIMLRVCL